MLNAPAGFKDSAEALMQALSGFDADFVDALENQQAGKLSVQEREKL